MSDKPILFSGPMIRAILDGRKTQTRRVVKFHEHLLDRTPTGELVNYYGDRRLGMRFPETTLVQPISYAPGDRLWVRETCAIWNGDHRDVVYRADESDDDWDKLRHDAKLGAWKIRPSIHMPRWASRLTLIVTDVRVQRLREISEADAIAEGLSTVTKDGGLWKWGIPDRDGFPGNDNYGWNWSDWHVDPRDAFRSLWDNLNEARGYGWSANPWVCAITFTAHRQNIDSMGLDNQ